MRGYGSPHHETATTELTRPDWGWGDASPSVWGGDSVDYGWGSERVYAFPPFLLSTVQVGDDGGYRIEISGTFPRGGASMWQRPTGFYISLLKDSIEYACYSGRAGQKTTCSTDLKGSALTGFTPRLDVGDYTVSFTYNKMTINVGTVSVLRRTRTNAEYTLRNTLPSQYATEARALEVDTILDANAVSARIEKHTVLYNLTRAIGESIGVLMQMGVLTRTTNDFTNTDTILHLETTLGMPNAGGVIIGGVSLNYTNRTNNSLRGITRPQGQKNTITRGERVQYDSHVIAD